MLKGQFVNKVLILLKQVLMMISLLLNFIYFSNFNLLTPDIRLLYLIVLFNF
jgi:hypothetical protein